MYLAPTPSANVIKLSEKADAIKLSEKAGAINH